MGALIPASDWLDFYLLSPLARTLARVGYTDFVGSITTGSRWGAFGWYPIATIDGFPGGRVWLVSSPLGSFAVYASYCLAKLSWALLRSNPTRDNQAKAGE